MKKIFIVIALIILSIIGMTIRKNQNKSTRELDNTNKVISTGTPNNPVTSEEGQLVSLKLNKNTFQYFKLPSDKKYWVRPIIFRGKDLSLVVDVKINGEIKKWKFDKDPFPNEQFDLIGFRINKDYSKDTHTIKITYEKYLK